MGDNQTAVAIAENIIGRKIENGGNCIGAQEEIAYTQNASGVMGVCTSIVRRLLPIECERLMGFPDNHTRIPWKGKPQEDCPDAPRYKACGNSMCVNVMQWIGEQIQKVKENI
jgi:DNA (cytosine-5)-methyltransferase 1